MICAAASLVRRAAPDRSGQAGPERLMNTRVNRPRELRLPPGVTALADFDADWDGFWSRLKNSGAVLADRSAETLRWRMADPDRTSPPISLVYRREGVITGWIMAQTAKMSRHEPPVLDIIDLAATPGEPDAVQALAAALVANGRRLGVAKVRLQVVSPVVLAALGPLAGRARREGGWGHAHARFRPDWEQRLKAGWSPTPFDGDYSFCLRPVPTR